MSESTSTPTVERDEVTAKVLADAPPKEPRFAPNLVAAVKYARMELHAKNPSLKKDQRPSAASVGDHEAVRAAITEALGGNVTADAVLKFVGLSLPKVEAVARFAPDTADDLKKFAPVNELSKGEKNRAWRSGRYAAGIVAAWVRELRASKS